jgi:Spy/CpxP family protein refolding chaperone
MKRFSLLLSIALTGLAGLSSLALADESSPAAPGHHRGGRGLRKFERCLANAGLSSEQQAATQSVLTDARPALQADIQTLKADRERLRADLQSGADKSVVGQDVLTQSADRNKLRTDMQATREQVLAKLTPEQRSAFDACAGGSGANAEDSPEEP